MRYPIVGTVSAGGETFDIVGHIVDGPRKTKIGHIVISGEEAMSRVCAAIGSGTPITLQAEPHPAQELEINLIEFDSSTLRFTVK